MFLCPPSYAVLLLTACYCAANPFPMTSPPTSYTTSTYHVGQAALCFAVGLVALLTALVQAAWFFHSESVAVVGWVGLCTVPFLFQKPYKAFFTRRLDVAFDDHGCVLTEFDRAAARVQREARVGWAQVRAYSFYFSASDITTLALYLRDGTTQRFAFNDGKGFDQASTETSAFSLFYYFLDQYNRHAAGEKIQCVPGFFATGAGRAVLFALAALVPTGVAGQLVFRLPHEVLYYGSGVCFWMVFALWGTRKGNEQVCARIAQLVPRPPTAETATGLPIPSA